MIKGGELIMSSKTQLGSQATKRGTRKPAELPSNERAMAFQHNGYSQDVHARISERAYALYEARGRKHNRALEDWLEAEQQVLNRI
jgi:hypothetical protein